MSDLFSIRDAEDRDLEYINWYAHCEGMDQMPSLDNIRVAVNDDDVVVGFLRLNFSESGRAYVNPMVTNRDWRGYGVGRALLEDAAGRAGELRLVARGTAVGFYRKLGFEAVDWSEIEENVTDDCDGCPMREECQPLPMKREQR